MKEVRDQYEQFPYPERDPTDEKKRLITGSPSHPGEIDTYIFGGMRDWSQPIKILIAGGGTGDSLIMIASMLATKKVPAEIHYIDLSQAACKIAEQRAEIRGLQNIIFHSDDILNASSYGVFDYIDCCGVLHHLKEPQAGFKALAGTLKPEGGLGGMVYAPFGRTGVYPLQAALRILVGDLPTRKKLSQAKKIVEGLPKTNWFPKNDCLGDHKLGDAGFYDLLLHSQDRAFTVTQLNTYLQQAGLALCGLIEPILYDPLEYLPDEAEIRARVKQMPPIEQAQLAENLSGAIKTHVFYACKSASKESAFFHFNPPPTNMQLVPRLKNIAPAKLAHHLAKKGRLSIGLSGRSYDRVLDKKLAPMIALIDGRPLGNIASTLGLDPISFQNQWCQVHHPLSEFNVLYYSRKF
jgi:SAM-dependent methyltransferase